MFILLLLTGLHAWFPGSYALPESVYGCPHSNDIDWVPSFIRIKTGTGAGFGSHISPSDYHVNGPFGDKEIEMHFCVRWESPNDSKMLPWPNGQYCVFKVGFQCPQGKKQEFSSSSTQCILNYNVMNIFYFILHAECDIFFM